ncbi:hypothetical protein BT69DRAFT_1354096 [Atractiella rhizophila]|nr:hypothetical protein BT69DRAFT_1354096 [Atractiella rhizophila]
MERNLSRMSGSVSHDTQCTPYTHLVVPSRSETFRFFSLPPEMQIEIARYIAQSPANLLHDAHLELSRSSEVWNFSLASQATRQLMAPHMFARILIDEGTRLHWKGEGFPQTYKTYVNSLRIIIRDGKPEFLESLPALLLGLMPQINAVQLLFAHSTETWEEVLRCLSHLFQISNKKIDLELVNPTSDSAVPNVIGLTPIASHIHKLSLLVRFYEHSLMTSISDATNLECLFIYFSSILPIFGLQSLACCPKLRQLHIYSYPTIGYATRANLHEIVALLNACQATLQELTLAIQLNMQSDQPIQAILPSFPNLRQLNLQNMFMRLSDQSSLLSLFSATVVDTFIYDQRIDFFRPAFSVVQDPITDLLRDRKREGGWSSLRRLFLGRMAWERMKKQSWEWTSGDGVEVCAWEDGYWRRLSF